MHPDFIPDVNAKLEKKNKGLTKLLSNICRICENICPDAIEWSGVGEWWAKNRQKDAIEEGERLLTTTDGSFEAKCEVLRKLTQKEREIIGYGRFPLRLEDYEL